MSEKSLKLDKQKNSDFWKQYSTKKFQQASESLTQ